MDKNEKIKYYSQMVKDGHGFMSRLVFADIESISSIKTFINKVMVIEMIEWQIDWQMEQKILQNTE